MGVSHVPDEAVHRFHYVWMWVALSGAIAFILIQLWLLVVSARGFGDAVERRIERHGGACCWHAVSTALTLLFYGLAVLGVTLLLRFFTTWQECTTNKLFIAINAGLCLLLSALTLLTCCGGGDSHTRTALLQTSVISLYIVYLTWTALSSLPREPTPVASPCASPFRSLSSNRFGFSQAEARFGSLTDQQFYCGPDDATFAYNDIVLPCVGIVIMFVSVVYSRSVWAQHPSCLIT